MEWVFSRILTKIFLSSCRWRRFYADCSVHNRFSDSILSLSNAKRTVQQSSFFSCLASLLQFSASLRRFFLSKLLCFFLSTTETTSWFGFFLSSEILVLGPLLVILVHEVQRESEVSSLGREDWQRSERTVDTQI